MLGASQEFEAEWHILTAVQRCWKNSFAMLGVGNAELEFVGRLAREFVNQTEKEFA